MDLRDEDPYKDDYLLFGCANSIWVLTGDPASSGQIDEVDLTVGMFGANSWCFDGKGNIYFWGTNGIYMIPPGFPEVINPTTHRITLEFDRKRNGIMICVTTLATGANNNFFYNITTEGFFPETYPTQCGVYSMLYYAANDNDLADLLIGCFDGYIRKYDDASKDDNIGVTTQAINSYCTLPIIQLSKDSDDKGLLNSLTVELSGGESGGDFTDSDGLTYELFTGDDAETCLEKIKDGATAFLSRSVTGTGRKRARDRIAGAWMGIKLYNSTASETWAVNKVFGNVIEFGGI